MIAVTFLLRLLLSATAVAGDMPFEADTTATPDGGAEPASATVDRDGAARLSRKALTRIKDGAWEEAAELLAQARTKDPGNAAITTDLAFALAHLGRRDEAERHYRAAVGLDPSRFYAYANLAELWTSDPTRWQRHDEMLAFLENALQTTANDPRAHAFIQLRVAELLRSLGRPSEARARLQPLTTSSVAAQVRRRALQLVESIDAEVGDRALEDWPAPAVPASDKAKLAAASADNDSRTALKNLDALVARWPAWTDARWARAQVLERMGQVDEAGADLTIVVQLAPSHARAWRRLGMLLAQHGGGFQAERADEALRHALALEPSWSDLRELRRQVATKRARGGRRAAGETAPEPSAKARQLLQDAQSWIGMDAPEMAPPLLHQALADSPAFVDAAAALYGIEHTVPETTVKALWNDGNGLWQLAQTIGALRSRDAGLVARPWIDRAVDLGFEEARFARASLRASTGDKAGALDDLRDYVATEPSPPRLEEARALRLTLTTANADSPERLAHGKLAQDKPSEALAALGGSCRPGLPFDSLLALGRVHEFMGHGADALACYQIALDGSAAVTADRKHRAWERLASAASGLAPSELAPLRKSLELALGARAPLAALSLARIAESERDWTQAATLARTFLDGADADDPRVAEAHALQARVGRVIESETEERHRRSERLQALVALLVLAVLIALLVRRRYLQTLSRALHAQPLLFPALAQAIGQVRHDVLKHRASALGLLADPATNRQDVARAFLEPEPASTKVADIYTHLAQEARALGLRLRPLSREPVFGPLAADLARAEAMLANDAADAEPLQTIDERLRGEHADRLQTLLCSGPRTTVDAGVLARWIEAMASEPGQRLWIEPRLNLTEPEVVFPLPESTLSSIVSNLLRNAVAVAAAEPNAAVEVRVERGRDGMGKRTVSLLIADSSSQPLELIDVENRPADRGLGIVRETTRSWGGEIVVRAETAPFRKTVGVRFAAPAEARP